ncbi:hypothetical protein LEMLEM_LOCUS7776 [Lemmus lemmus]
MAECPCPSRSICRAVRLPGILLGTYRAHLMMEELINSYRQINLDVGEIIAAVKKTECVWLVSSLGHFIKQGSSINIIWPLRLHSWGGQRHDQAEDLALRLTYLLTHACHSFIPATVPCGSAAGNTLQWGHCSIPQFPSAGESPS